MCLIYKLGGYQNKVYKNDWFSQNYNIFKSLEKQHHLYKQVSMMSFVFYLLENNRKFYCLTL